MAALGGARRTESALDRFVRHSTVNSAIVYVTPPTGDEAYPGVPVDEADRRRAEERYLTTLRGLPDVAWVGRLMPVIMATGERAGKVGWTVTLGYVPLDGG